MSRRCSNCYWVDWGDVEDLDNDPCEHCRYDPGRYNWRSRNSPVTWIYYRESRSAPVPAMPLGSAQNKGGWA